MLFSFNTRMRLLASLFIILCHYPIVIFVFIVISSHTVLVSMFGYCYFVARMNSCLRRELSSLSLTDTVWSVSVGD